MTEAAARGNDDDGERASPASGDAQSFEHVLAYELEAIAELRRRRGQGATPAACAGPVEEAHESRLTGLAFSGGGIRSATFNLGVATALARLGLLRRFDYLSLTSGGGYIGGWLLAWAHRQGFAAVEAELARCAATVPPDGAAAAGARPEEPAEPEPVAFLRRFSNYLTPRVGVFTADTWTFVTTYLRNFLLTLSILILALAALLLVPRLVVMVSETVHDHLQDGLLPAIVLLLICLVGIGLNLRTLALPEDQPRPRYTAQGWVQLMVVAPLFLSAWMFGLWIWFAKLAPDDNLLVAWLGASWSWFGRASAGVEDGLEPATWALLAAGLYAGVWLLAGVLSALFDRSAGVWAAGQGKLWRSVVLAAPVAGALGGLMLYGIAALSDRMSDDLAGTAGQHLPWHLFHVNVWKAPAIALVFLITAFVHTGLMGRRFPDKYREWWSRLGAWLLIYAIAWLALFGIAIYGPIVLIWLGTMVTVGLGAGWTVLSGIGAQIARSLPGGEGGSTARLRSAVAAVAPQVFILGLLVAIALGLHIALVPEPDALSPVCRTVWHQAGTSFRTVLDCQSERMWLASGPIAAPLLCPLLLGLALFLSWRIDINQFSMHLFYRNRLIRTFLGASNSERRPQAFTGFDAGDDLPLADLAPERGSYDGPVPLINTALNLVAGQELAWQERKAAAYVLSSGYSGFDLGAAAAKTPPQGKLCAGGFRPTADYEDDGGISLGTAMGISGAAVSASMGAATRSSTAFLLTVFNARLGWWLGNPRHRDSWPRMGPRLGLLSLLAELFGQTTAGARYVYLSDGGHFDNLGLYELVRRRCRFIVLSDAGADPEYRLADLGAAIRKCRTDFGVEIDIDTTRVRPSADQPSAWHCAIGTVRYPETEPGASPGTLLYLKASLTGDEPADVHNYASENPLFPHEPTADQWFAESQFESYRKLGEHVALSVFSGVCAAPAELATEALIVELRRAWYPPSKAAAAARSIPSRTIDRLYQRLRTDPHLAFLRPQLYPEWRKVARSLHLEGAPRNPLPQSTEELDHGLYFCSALLQLAESTYLELDLENEALHPDNRGRMNLLRYWATSPMVRLTWSLTAGTFGARFQAWAEAKLGLRVGAIRVDRHPADAVPEGLDETERALLGRVVGAAVGTGGSGELFVFSLEAGQPDARGRQPTLPFGFAVAEGDRFVYFRIQDHLRCMGLARRALERLLEMRSIRQVPVRAAFAGRDAPSSEDLARFRSLVRSVRFALASRRPPAEESGRGAETSAVGVEAGR